MADCEGRCEVVKRLKLTMQLHAGDCCSLFNELERALCEREELDWENRELRMRMGELESEIQVLRSRETET